jgi:hypothetical protein
LFMHAAAADDDSSHASSSFNASCNCIIHFSIVLFRNGFSTASRISRSFWWLFPPGRATLGPRLLGPTSTSEQDNQCEPSSPFTQRQRIPTSRAELHTSPAAMPRQQACFKSFSFDHIRLDHGHICNLYNTLLRLYPDHLLFRYSRICKVTRRNNEDAMGSYQGLVAGAHQLPFGHLFFSDILDLTSSSHRASLLRSLAFSHFLCPQPSILDDEMTQTCMHFISLHTNPAETGSAAELGFYLAVNFCPSIILHQRLCGRIN